MKKYIYLLIATTFVFNSCSDFLDKTDPTKAWDDTYWVSESNLDLYANNFYPYFFQGYGLKYATNYAPFASFQFSDDIAIFGTQSQFSFVVPTVSVGSTSDTPSGSYQSQYTGPEWNFAWIRKANVMQDRIEQRMKNKLSTQAYNHWMGIAKFFKAVEYARLVNVFGDVPYYVNEVINTDLDELYKDRTPRNDVMDAVYEDFQFALNNVKVSAGDLKVNKYVVAAYVSRWALIEGTWQKYYYNDNVRAVKFLSLATAAAEIVMNSGKYDIVTDFRSLFTQNDLVGNKDVIMYRKYDAALEITHSIASQCNMQSPTTVGVNLDLLQAFICTDGKNYQASSVANANKFTIANMIKTRDSRFEASFLDYPTSFAKSSYVYCTKFIPRSALNYLTDGTTIGAEFQAEKAVTSYPDMRYAEVLLNWIEAKVELQNLGSGTVTQADIDLSINKIRNRPLAAEAIAKGVTKTEPLNIASIHADPNRDPSVGLLLWEVRRERRMEFVLEYSRIIDLRRWGKLEYMDTKANENLLMGAWIDFPTELPTYLNDDNKGKLRVYTATGDFVTYDGNNASLMKGYWYPADNKSRNPFLNVINVNPYLCPIGKGNINSYKDKGYTLSQTEGWSSN